MAGLPSVLQQQQGATGIRNASVSSPNNPFTLGPITFSRFEIPSEFTIGHELHVATHQYISENGVPVIKVHAMGAFPQPVNWKGILYGGSALTRMQQIDRLCVQQSAIVWQYCQLSYLVLINKFSATVMYQTEVHYEIELTVIQDLNGAQPLPTSQESFDYAVQNSFALANAAVGTLKQIDPLLPASIVQEAASISASIVSLYPLAAQEAITIINLIADIIALNEEIGNYLAPLENTAVLEADLAKLNAAFAAQQYYGVLAANLGALTGSGPQSLRLSVGAGTNLYAIAAQQYPNADLSTAVSMLALANNLTDFFIYQPTTLNIPPLLS